MKERIQKILSASGLCSRRQAEEWIAAGRVTCNGSICGLGDQADAGVDTICLDGVPIPSRSEFVYIMLHKPKGVVTTLSDEKGRKNAAQLVANCGQRVYPVGRLDMDSEGLLLFTNDGEFANRFTHPKHNIDKTYKVWVTGFHEDALRKLQQPVVLDGYRIHPPKVQVLQSCGDATAQLLITIHEGRNRQVRRMCAIAGMSVKRLVRLSEGALSLGDLKPGTWRYLSAEEIDALKK